MAITGYAGHFFGILISSEGSSFAIRTCVRAFILIWFFGVVLVSGCGSRDGGAVRPGELRKFSAVNISGDKVSGMAWDHYVGRTGEVRYVSFSTIPRNTPIAIASAPKQQRDGCYFLTFRQLGCTRSMGICVTAGRFYLPKRSNVILSALHGLSGFTLRTRDSAELSK